MTLILPEAPTRAACIIDYADLVLANWYRDRNRTHMTPLPHTHRVWRDAVRDQIRRCLTLGEAVRTLRQIRVERGW